MAYRGEDLDLRLSQGRTGRDGFGTNEFALNGTRPRSPMPSGRPDPVTIDDTVMACCNHAYDIAQAHGASEVRLEHLVHALTRVEAAADILEERGIREAHLRRESAAVIASEIPVGLAHSQSAPRASAEFEDVLRRASAQASSNGGARGATVHDLLWVLLNYNREIPAIALLLRHAAGWQSWDWPNRAAPARDVARDVERDEPRRREPAPAPRVDRGVDRVVDRRPARPAPAYAAPEPRERLSAAPAPSFNTDGLQGRLDQMEQSMRALQSEMASDRRALTDLIRDLQRDVLDSRGSGGATADLGPMVDQLRAVEANVEDRLGDLARTASALTDRLHGLEKSVSSQLQEGSRNWLTVGDRLKNIDKVVSSGSTSGLADLVTDQLVAVTEQVRQATQRLEALERNIETRQADGQRVMSGVAERLRSLDEQVTASRREQQSSVQSLAQISNQAPAAIQSLLADRFQSFKGQFDQKFDQKFDQSRLDLTSAMAQVVEPLAARVQQLEGSSGQLMQTLVQRVSGLDGSMKAQNDSAKADFVEMHDALVKLGGNQQTLAGNLDQWRLESGGDLGIISNRLELLERGSGQPLEMLRSLQTDMVALQQVALADYDHNRRGFKNWLFGTDDIFAGSWRDETTALRTRLRQMRGEGTKA
jgi:predicted  nucleic acid-binding Zn-ribbon protein